MDETDVKLNEALDRFETTVDGETAYLTLDRDGERVVLRHTEVPDRLEGRGIGTAIVRAALAHARSSDWTVVPRCPFVRDYLERHPEAANGLRLEPPDPSWT